MRVGIDTLAKRYYLKECITKDNKKIKDWVGVYELYDVPYHVEDEDHFSFLQSDRFPKNKLDFFDSTLFAPESDSFIYTYNVFL